MLVLFLYIAGMHMTNMVLHAWGIQGDFSKITIVLVHILWPLVSIWVVIYAWYLMFQEFRNK